MSDPYGGKEDDDLRLLKRNNALEDQVAELEADKKELECALADERDHIAGLKDHLDCYRYSKVGCADLTCRNDCTRPWKEGG
jgi:hypothetical protein